MGKTFEQQILREMYDLDAHFDDRKTNNIHYLMFRWEDEREYEDFNEYRAVMKKHLAKSIYEFISLDTSFNLVVKNTKTGHFFNIQFEHDDEPTVTYLDEKEVA